MLSQRVADRTSPTFIANGRLKAVYAPGSRVRRYDVFLKPLKVWGVSGRQEAPFVVSACLGAEGAELDTKSACYGFARASARGRGARPGGRTLSLGARHTGATMSPSRRRGRHCGLAWGGHAVSACPAGPRVGGPAATLPAHVRSSDGGCSRRCRTPTRGGAPWNWRTRWRRRLAWRGQPIAAHAAWGRAS